MKPELAILLADHDAVYVEIPKVACSSLKLAFAELLGITLAGDGNPHEARFPTAAPSENPRGPMFPEHFAFAFVRNPWDRLVSCYRDKICGEVGAGGFTHFTIRPGVADCLAGYDVFTAGMVFADFVDAIAEIPDAEADPHFRAQSTFISNAAGERAIDFTGRFERLAEDFLAVKHRLDIGALALPWAQSSGRPTGYTEFYTPRTRRVVETRFGADIAGFGYRFGEA